ncbi:hypothetical protein V5799_008290 [Amblyomma americanum]|uniref:Uncharacterized protein n=1 Tax=Amblyomma americanum TaxID=6943 RepID=A0AAQ4FF51_AMBAM
MFYALGYAPEGTRQLIPKDRLAQQSQGCFLLPAGLWSVVISYCTVYTSYATTLPCLRPTTACEKKDTCCVSLTALPHPKYVLASIQTHLPKD